MLGSPLLLLLGFFFFSNVKLCRNNLQILAIQFRLYCKAISLNSALKFCVYVFTSSFFNTWLVVQHDISAYFQTSFYWQHSQLGKSSGTLNCLAGLFDWDTQLHDSTMGHIQEFNTAGVNNWVLDFQIGLDLDHKRFVTSLFFALSSVYCGVIGTILQSLLFIQDSGRRASGRVLLIKKKKKHIYSTGYSLLLKQF